MQDRRPQSSRDIIARHYGMDWLRIGAFGLLIFYHIGMYFVWWDWHVKSPVQPDWVTIPMLASNAWRLPLLFLTSGFASAALLAKLGSPRAFFASRSIRLMIPLLFGMTVVVAPQPWVELMFKHGYDKGFAYFWMHDYFRFGPLDGIVLPTWQHLWFVVYLWVYTAFLSVVVMALGSPAIASRLTDGFGWLLGGPRLLLVPVAWFGLCDLGLFRDWEITHGLFDDAKAHATYLPVFLIGFLLARSPTMWTDVRRLLKPAAVIALSAFAIVAGAELLWPGNSIAPDWAYPLVGGTRIIQGWCAIVALLGIADRYLNHDRPSRVMLNEAVFPYYIIHQTIIVLVGWWLLAFDLPASLAFTILVAATVAGCWLFYRIGRETPYLRPLIGLKGFRPVRRESAEIERQRY